MQAFYFASARGFAARLLRDARYNVSFDLSVNPHAYTFFP